MSDQLSEYESDEHPRLHDDARSEEVIELRQGPKVFAPLTRASMDFTKLS